jgi:hypothetical protein
LWIESGDAECKNVEQWPTERPAHGSKDRSWFTYANEARVLSFASCASRPRVARNAKCIFWVFCSRAIIQSARTPLDHPVPGRKVIPILSLSLSRSLVSHFPFRDLCAHLSWLEETSAPPMEQQSACSPHTFSCAPPPQPPRVIFSFYK